MKGQKPTPENFDFQLDENGVIGRRVTTLLADGAYLFEDELRIAASLSAKVITSTAWLLELYQLRGGQLFFIQGQKKVLPETRAFGVLYAPFTIAELGFSKVKAKVIGVAATAPLPSEFAAQAVVFETTFSGRPTSVNHIIEILRLAQNCQSVDFNSKPSLLSLRAKRLIDGNYLLPLSIARVASRLNVTHAHLSRQFKRDFGLTPLAYLHQLRMADAPLRLARGEEIVNVSMDVGYNDLSRFYKQFRKNTNASPGACQKLLNLRLGKYSPGIESQATSKSAKTRTS